MQSQVKTKSIIKADEGDGIKQPTEIMITKVLSYIPVLLVIFLDILTVYYCVEQIVLHPVFLDVKITAAFIMVFTLAVFTAFVFFLSKEMRDNK